MFGQNGATFDLTSGYNLDDSNETDVSQKAFDDVLSPQGAVRETCKLKIPTANTKEMSDVLIDIE